ALNRALTVAVGARRLNDAPLAAASGTRRRHDEKPALAPHLAGAVAAFAGDGTCSRFSAAAAALFALFSALDLNRLFDSLVCFAQRHVDFDRDVLAAMGFGPPPSAAERLAAENIAEDVAEIDVALEAAESGPRTAGGSAVDAGMAISIIGGALLRVRKDFIGFVDRLEFAFGFFVSRIAVRVKLDRLTPVRRFDFVLRRVFFDA